MRNDMQKVITECYRWRGFKHNNFQRSEIRDTLQQARFLDSEDGDDLSLDFLDKKNSIRSHKVLDRFFDFGENLNPLFRFLESCVGRPWDDVYSEIKESISSNGTLGHHVLQHVDWHVSQGDDYWFIRYGVHRGLYVSTDGILCRASDKKEKKRDCSFCEKENLSGDDLFVSNLFTSCGNEECKKEFAKANKNVEAIRKKADKILRQKEKKRKKESRDLYRMSEKEFRKILGCQDEEERRSALREFTQKERSLQYPWKAA